MNRVFQFMQRPCPECRAKREHEALKAQLEAIETDALGSIDFLLPSLKQLAGEREEYDDDERQPCEAPTTQIFIALEGERTPLDTDLRAYAIRELRRIADELIVAADALEGGAE